MITEDYVSFETAKLLKEKGFDCECRAYYTNSVVIGEELHLSRNEPYDYNNGIYPSYSAPTLQVAMKWLRETHNIYIAVNITYSENPKIFHPDYYVSISNTKTGETCIKEMCTLVEDETLTPKGFNTPEEAYEASIKYCLENLI